METILTAPYFLIAVKYHVNCRTTSQNYTVLINKENYTRITADLDFHADKNRMKSYYKGNFGQ